MADVVDRAQDHIEREAEERERAIRRMADQPAVDDCVRCGEPVGDARRALRLPHCLPCAHAIEAERNRGRRW